MKYARDRAADEAVSLAARPAGRDPRALARVWAAEVATVGGRAPGLNVLPPAKRERWLADAARFIAACDADRVDPTRVVAALFDYARVARRRGRRWVPSLASARSEFAKRIHLEWEARQRDAAGADPGARVAAARRLASAQRAPAPAAPPPRRSVVRKRRAVAVPRDLDRDRARSEAALFETLDRDASAFLARSRLNDPRGVAPEVVVELDPLAFSPAFRALAGAAIDGDELDRLAAYALRHDVRGVAVARLAAGGVPAALFD